ncbi:hypothetical protein B0J14DRAFT_660712 [Halenospora varia]|nr:hypothetical protein B0J14DRAFT_660712 [Halenospora varia]
MKNAKLKNGWTRVGLNSTTYDMIVKLNSLIIVGENLTSKPRFIKSLFRYLKWATIVEELIKVLPPFLNLTSLVANTLMKYGRNIDEISALVTEKVIERWDLPAKDCKEKYRAKGATVEGVVRQAIALFFSSFHQLPMLISFSLYTPCQHPEYLEPLRKETEEFPNGLQGTNSDDMPLLDIFLSEVAWCNPIVTAEEELRREQETRLPTLGDVFNWAWPNTTGNPALPVREARLTDLVNGQLWGETGAQEAMGQQIGYAAVRQMIDQYINAMNPFAPAPIIRLGQSSIGPPPSFGLEYGGARQKG